MTPRPLRPAQSSRRIDDHDGGDGAGETPVARPGQGPVVMSAGRSLPKRSTCLQCRVRKVRCDGREGLCQNCSRLGFECSFQKVSSESSQGRYAPKLPPSRRRMQACAPCHLKKTRCRGELPRCSSCVRSGRDCIYPTTVRRQNVPPSTSTSASIPTTTAAAVPADDRSSDPGRETPAQQMTVVNDESPAPASAEPTMAAEKQIEDYFDHLYPLPSFAFLHKQTVIRRCRDGTMNEPLRLAICAITALHLQRTWLPHDVWAQQAEQLIIQQIGRPSIFHLQALILVVRYRIESGEFATAFMLAALAARTALALRLNYERAELAFVAQEARRRLFWALYLLDDYFCVGLREFELCPEETIHLQLPCREALFEAEMPCRTGLLRPMGGDDVSAIGLRGVFMRLTSVRRAIMRFNRRVGLGEESASTISDSIRRLERDLAHLQGAVGLEGRYSGSGPAACKWPAQFVMLHMSYHQCYCDLYRMFLNGYSEAAPSGLLASLRAQDCIAMQAKCLEHAEDIIRVLADFTQSHAGDNGRLLLLERDAAVCAFESARLIMFGTRLPCATSTLQSSIQKAEGISLVFITKFFPHSASTQPLKSALEHLIATYKTPDPAPLNGQTPQIPPSEPEFEPEPEPEPVPAVPHTSGKVSQYASSRQRLSVQSLLLQSDFADNSHEIVGSGDGDAAPLIPLLPPLLPTITTAITPPTTTTTPPTTATTTTTTTITTTTPVIPDQDPARQPRRQPRTITIDACREDAGLIFNPWMGFAGTEELYGFPGGLSEEY
ncbi:hypothetical protein F4861DRAFT_353737 [Xylaria intraflava]|nr:hypothetical protein F4861DRAFT_353737 [Xylaria intraflava]